MPAAEAATSRAPAGGACVFDRTLAAHGLAPLARGRVACLQVNVGRLGNMRAGTATSTRAPAGGR